MSEHEKEFGCDLVAAATDRDRKPGLKRLSKDGGAYGKHQRS